MLNTTRHFSVKRRITARSKTQRDAGTYGSSELSAEHLLVLAVLTLQRVDMALHPEHHVCHCPLP